MRGWPRFGIVAIALIGAAVALTGGAGASARASDQAALTPIVLFPAYHFTRLLVTVHDQRVDPTWEANAICDRSGDHRANRSCASLLVSLVSFVPSGSTV